MGANPVRIKQWAFGIATYGMGTAVESAITLFGNTVWLTKLWYITGALLGGYPLAQGSLYLSWPRRTANKLTLASLTLVVAATIFTILSPVIIEVGCVFEKMGNTLGERGFSCLPRSGKQNHFFVKIP